jgi:hypothetical protein
MPVVISESPSDSPNRSIDHNGNYAHFVRIVADFDGLDGRRALVSDSYSQQVVDTQRLIIRATLAFPEARLISNREANGSSIITETQFYLGCFMDREVCD